MYSYEVVLKHKDTKGQLMSLQQTLRQEIHAKIGAQTAEESAKRKVLNPARCLVALLTLWQPQRIACSAALWKESLHVLTFMYCSMHLLAFAFPQRVIYAVQESYHTGLSLYIACSSKLQIDD